VIGRAEKQMNLIARDAPRARPRRKFERVIGGIRQAPDRPEVVRADADSEYVALSRVNHATNERTAAQVSGFVQ
jgi:hypothetical protein